MKCIVTWDLTPAYALSIAFLRVRSDKVIQKRTAEQIERTETDLVCSVCQMCRAGSLGGASLLALASVRHLQELCGGARCLPGSFPLSLWHGAGALWASVLGALSMS